MYFEDPPSQPSHQPLDAKEASSPASPLTPFRKALREVGDLVGTPFIAKQVYAEKVKPNLGREW